MSCKIIAPTLAAGCSVILKPAPETPLYAWLLAECLEEAGLPPGVFSFVPAGREVGDHLVRHPGVDKVSLIGSVAAGRHIASVCGQRLTRASLELGGKSPAVILDDIEPEQVIPKLIPHFTMNAGQMCAGLTRIIVPGHKHDLWADAIGSALRTLQVGDPFDAKTHFGPLAMKRQYDTVLGYFDQGRQEGARVITGGERRKDQPVGYYVEPTLFSGTNDMVVAREEIFGPVSILMPHKGFKDAIRIANDTEYGLNGAVYTNDADLAYKATRRIRAGNMTHNDWVNDVTFPFGGFKSSGIGRDGGPEGLALFQEVKVVVMNVVPRRCIRCLEPSPPADPLKRAPSDEPFRHRPHQLLGCRSHPLPLPDLRRAAEGAADPPRPGHGLLRGHALRRSARESVKAAFVPMMRTSYTPLT